MTNPKRKALWDTVPEETAVVSKEARPDRVGRNMIGFYVPAAAYRQLRLMALDESTTNQELLTEALNMLFKSRKKQTIA